MCGKKSGAGFNICSRGARSAFACGNRETGVVLGSKRNNMIDDTVSKIEAQVRGVESLSPERKAELRSSRLNSTTTLAAEYAKQGRDWEK